MSGDIRKKYLRRCSGKGISLISVILFIAAVLIIFMSNRYMEICSQREALERANSEKLSGLGDSLAEASDHLTDEARRYAVTGDISHLGSYWREVRVTRTRDRVIAELSAYELSPDELALLENAKRYSDELIETERLAMKLTLMSQGKTALDYSYDGELYEYAAYVEECELPEEYEGLTEREMSSLAAQILYDSFYNESKTMIMTPIEEFRAAINTRLAGEVEEAAQGRRFASLVQIIGSFFVLALTGLLILAVNILYIRPINRYSEAILADKTQSGVFGGEMSQLRVTPDGASELYRFGEAFNRLSLILFAELKRRAEAQEQMRRAKEEADNANAAKTQFVAQMSHELRTPLNAISGYLHLLLSTELSEPQRRYCRSIELASDNLLGLINNVLDFSKIETKKLVFESAELDIYTLTDDICAMLENSAKAKEISLKCTADENIPRFLKGDPLRLRQVLINLVSNGIKFTERGSVELSAKLAEDLGDRVILRFDVTDTGIGISETDKRKIFKPFVQSDAGVTRKYGGSGLGLSISDMIVREYSGGKYGINVESSQGKGSRFYFLFELIKADAPKALPAKDAPAPTKPVTVLLVDDNEINLDVESEMLSLAGVTAITAASGREALEKAAHLLPDAVLLDLHMPQMDGFETASRLKKLWGGRDIPLIALTADVTPQTAERAKKHGFCACLSKPVQPYELLSALSGGSQNGGEAEKPGGCAPIFSEEEALERLGGNKRLLIRLAERFVQAHEKSAEYVRTHLQNGSLANAEGIVHDIKGLAGNLSCKRLFLAASELCEQLKQKRQDSLDEFIAAAEETMAALKEYTAANAKAAPAPDRADISDKELIKELLYLCESCDIRAAELFEENKGAFDRIFGRELSDRLSLYTEKYDLSAAADIIRKSGV